MEHIVRSLIKAGKPVVGTCVTVNNPYLLNMFGQAGFDFIFIDTQHTPIGAETLHDMIKGLFPTKSDIIVRVIWNSNELINQAFDLGADGVVVPLINNKEEAARAVAGGKYHPAGARSWGPSEIGRYKDYFKQANKELMVFPMDERVEAVNNLDGILSVDGVDGAWIGPVDLAITQGLKAAMGQPESEEITQKILDTCKKYHKASCMFTGGYDHAAGWFKKGLQVANIGSDLGYVSQGLTKMFSDVKDLKAQLATKASK